MRQVGRDRTRERSKGALLGGMGSGIPPSGRTVR